MIEAYKSHTVEHYIGIFHLSSFIQPQVVPNLYGVVSGNTKGDVANKFTLIISMQ